MSARQALGGRSNRLQYACLTSHQARDRASVYNTPRKVKGGRLSESAVRGLHQTASELAASGSDLNLDASHVASIVSHLQPAEALTSLYDHVLGAVVGNDSNGLHEASLYNPTTTTVALNADPSSITTAVNVALATVPSATEVVHAAEALEASQATMQQLGAALLTSLHSLQNIDFHAYESMSASLTSVLAAVNGVMGAEAYSSMMNSASILSISAEQLAWAVQTSRSTSEAMVALTTMQLAASAFIDRMTTDTSALSMIVVACVALIMASVPWVEQEGATTPGGTGVPDDSPSHYDPAALKAYFGRRPVQVLQRQAEVAGKLASFLTAVIADWQSGQWTHRAPERAVWLRNIFESLGPAYIKIAQALSTRVDMLPDAYLEEFKKLQDAVPPFSSKQAHALIESELGVTIGELFEELSKEPVASASLGQVYRGKLRSVHGGGEVAVKVQRPHVMEQVALDTLLMRQASELVSAIPTFSEGWSDVLDDWATRFFQVRITGAQFSPVTQHQTACPTPVPHSRLTVCRQRSNMQEMDYEMEAVNMITFREQMADVKQIVIPKVRADLTTRRVIITSWVDGLKLSACPPQDVLPLCGPLLNCYLVQLLETGFLHADPHPGNLLRTPDGRICILDFGLVSEVGLDQRIHLVEFIAHLSLEDWDAVTHDLVALGFLPKDTSTINIEVIAPVIKEVMGQLVLGGTSGISMGSLTLQLEGVARKFRMIIPPYFALVLRAFSVIEGIAMAADPDYQIVASCFPYLCKRLITDDHPRMRAALKQLLYGHGTRLDVERLQRVFAAFGTFAAAPATRRTAQGVTFSDALGGGEELIKRMRHSDIPEPLSDNIVIIDDNMKEVLLVIFSKKGNYMQELLVDEMVAAVDAMSRQGLSEALRMTLASNAAISALRSVEGLGPLRAMLLPMPIPLHFLNTMNTRMTLTSEDRQALDTIALILDAMGGTHTGAHIAPPSTNGLDLSELLSTVDNTWRTGASMVQGAGDLAPIIPELLPGVQHTAEMFMSQLLRRVALRFADDLAPIDVTSRADSSPAARTRN